MIKKLESAGLGYHVSADETEDKLGVASNYTCNKAWIIMFYRKRL